MLRTLGRVAAVGGTLALVVTLSSCARPSTATPPTGVVKPPRVAAHSLPTPLPAGRESMYSLLNVGTWAEADELLNNRWKISRFDPVDLAGMPTWREDPYQDQYWRFIFYSLRPTSNLLWAYYQRGEARYREKLLDILRSYVAYDTASHPVDRLGMDEPHALAFRAMVLVNTFVKLNRSGDLPADLVASLTEAIRRVGDKLVDPANYQAHHNHAFTQAAALLLLNANLPELDARRRWGDLGYSRMAELLTQIIDEDGVQVEKSPFYHFYVMDFALELERWSERGGVPLPAGFHERVRAMARFAAEIIWPNGNIPLVGSSVALRPEGSAALYADLMREYPELEFAITSGRAGRPPGGRAVLFPHSGHAVLRSVVDASRPYRDNTQVVMDVGPPRTAHAHLEALGVRYYASGRDLIVDSGLYTYADDKGRAYFFGTSAHNTVVVDGVNQIPGPVTAGLTATGDDWAYQSGAAAVNRGVTHRRSVLLLRRDLALVVDTLTAAEPHTYEQLWHLFPGARLTTEGLRMRAHDEFDNPAVRVDQVALGDQRLALQTYYGENNPKQGWYSAQFGRMQPNYVGGYRLTGARNAAYLTLLSSGRYAADTATAVRGGVDLTGGVIEATVCTADLAATVTIRNQSAEREAVNVDWAGRCVR